MKIKGYAPITINLVEKVIDVVENGSIKMEWHGGLVGSVEWTLHSSNGKTLNFTLGSNLTLF